MNFPLIVPVWIAYQVIGAYVARAAFKNGYIRLASAWEWAFAVTSWPWIMWHVRKVNKERDRLEPFEAYMDRWEQEQIDKRLSDTE